MKKNNYDCFRDTSSLNYKNLLLSFFIEDSFDKKIFDIKHDLENATATVTDINGDKIILVANSHNIVDIYEYSVSLPNLFGSRQYVVGVNGENVWRCI